MKEQGLKLFYLLEKATNNFSTTHFTDSDLENTKRLLVELNPLQLFIDPSSSFSLGQPTKFPDGKIKFSVLIQSKNSQQNFFLMIDSNGSFCY